MEKNYRKYVLGLVVFLLLIVTVGYATLQTTLNINGTATAKGNTWSISLVNVANKTGVTPTTEPTISGTTISYAVSLAKPGESYSFTFDVKNDGTLPAKLNTAPTVTGSSSYIIHTVEYSDGTTPAAGDTLAAGATITYKVTVTFDSTKTTVPSTDEKTEFKIALDYVQA